MTSEDRGGSTDGTSAVDAGARRSSESISRHRRLMAARQRAKTRLAREFPTRFEQLTREEIARGRAAGA